MYLCYLGACSVQCDQFPSLSCSCPLAGPGKIMVSKGELIITGQEKGTKTIFLNVFLTSLVLKLTSKID